jgi:hypothetical protein
MARDFAKADVVINNVQRVIGTYHAPFATTLFFDIGDEFDTLVTPLLTGVWHVDGVDQLEMFYYWTSTDDGDGLIEPSFYITENTELSDEIPRNYNKTPTNGGPERAEGDKVYNALRNKLKEEMDKYVAAEQAAVEAQRLANQWVAGETAPANIQTLKAYRNDALLLSDWTQIPDSPLSDDKKTEWANYRQAMRDLPGQQADPYNPDNFTGWPSKP